jgi:hydrogenase/urease accessory protein HupE
VRKHCLRWLALLLVCSSAAAHEIRSAVATIELMADGRYELALAVNIEAVVAAVSPQHRDTDESPNAREYNRLRALAPEALRAAITAHLPHYLEGIALAFDGERLRPALSGTDIPDVGDVALSRQSVVRLSGTAPAGAKTLSFSYPARHGDCVLRVREGAGQRLDAVWLKNGVRSAPYVVGKGFDQRTLVDVVREYTVLGFTHIVPLGLDHILFVLGLLLLSTRMAPLLIQVTAFTVAHSVTLALSVFGVLSLPSSIVEPLIAASIVYVAVENIFTRQLKPWRALVVFAFGLLHGLGFAGVLNEVGLPQGQFVPALVSFNIGVELGQLAVIAMAFVAVGLWARNKTWYRARVMVPESTAIALVGLFWTVQRVMGD